ncbi:MAG: flagellar motor switch protein FliM [Chloroflexi bacterium]|nr:flagellar motor switch protein FliM [Chloroflexota bacterium]
MDVEAKKVLSQWEIDSLLGSLDSQEGTAAGMEVDGNKNVRLYDFRRPGKFSKEHLRAIQTIHESFAHGTASSLSSYLRTGVQLQLSSVEQAVYEEYIEQLSNPTVLAIVSADPLPGHMIIEMNMGLAFALIDRLLGGTGLVPQKLREVTDVELILLQTLIKSLLASLRESWLQIHRVNLKLDEMVFNPEIVHSALPADVGVLLLFELRMKETSNIISIFTPYTMLEPIIGKLTSQMWLAGVRKDVSGGQDAIRMQLEKVDLPVKAELGTATVSVRELIGLQRGDVIVLETGIKEELEVMVAGKHKYYGRPGRIGRRLGVAITRTSQEENDLRKAQTPEAVLVGEEQQ